MPRQITTVKLALEAVGLEVELAPPHHLACPAILKIPFRLCQHHSDILNTHVT